MSPTTVASLAERIDTLLPQTQCRRCGYEGCRPYAEAIVAGASIDRCPPGGEALVAVLARLTGRPVMPLDRTRGEPSPLMLARIDESACIGCTLCIEACPVDAIVGARRRMHTALPALCTGCALCVPPCPVDCITMLPAGRAWSPEDARGASSRHARRLERRRRARDASGTAAKPADDGREARRAAVAAALARARARRAAVEPQR